MTEKNKDLKKIHPISRFQVIKPFYLFVKQKLDKDNFAIIEPVYKLWRCSFGAGNPSFLILTNHVKELPLGDNEKCLFLPKYNDLVNYFSATGFPPENIIKDICKMLNKEVVNENNSINIQRTMLEVILNSDKIYKTSIPITDEYLQHLVKNPTELQGQINLFLAEDCDKDSKVLLWAKSRLVRVSDSLEDYWIEKYRGHSLVIKNPKSGFSYLAQKLGRDVTYTSSASIRGYADAQGNIHHGVYHANFGSVALDEASHYREVVSDVALTFMELGRQEVTTAGINLTNLGSPAITIILNAGKDVAKPEDMLEAIDKILPSLTTVPEAFGSRFGLIIFSNDLKQVKQKVFLSQSQIKENELIIESIFEALIAKIKELYSDALIQKWLNTPLPHYTEQVLSLTHEFHEEIMFGKRCKIFWIDHGKSAYRHVRGVALECAIVDSVSELLESEFIAEELTRKIIEKAEEELEIVKAINLDSLKTMVGITEKSEKKLNEMMVQRYELLQGYKKTLVFAYSYYSGKHKASIKEGKYVLLDEIASEFEAINYEKRKELFGSAYATFSRVIQQFERLSDDAKKRLQQDLESLFGLELSYSENQHTWLFKHLSDSILYLMDYCVASVVSVVSTQGSNVDTPDDTTHTTETTQSEVVE